MTLKEISKKCKTCGSKIQVPTSNKCVNCPICGSSNCKNPEAYRTDEDRYLESMRKADQRANDWYE